MSNKIINIDGVKRLVPIGNSSNSLGSTGISKKTYYINNCNFNIIVVDSNNLKFEVPSTPSLESNDFIIREEYYIPHYNVKNLLTSISKNNNELISNSAITEIEKGLKSNPNKGLLDTIITIDNVFNSHTIKKNNHIFSKESNIVISASEIDKVPNHPFLTSELMFERFNRLISETPSLILYIDLVSNEDEIGDRYLSTGNKLFKIVSRKSDLTDSGAYLSYYELGSNSILYHNKYSLNNLEGDLGIYKTKEEAFTGGDTKLNTEKLIMELKHDLEIKRIEAEKIKHECNSELLRLKKDYETELLAAKKEYEANILSEKLNQTKLEAQIKEQEQLNKETLLKLEAERIKANTKYEELKREYEEQKIKRDDYYESRHHERKDNTEVLKYVIGIATILLGGYYAFKKSK